MGAVRRADPGHLRRRPPARLLARRRDAACDARACDLSPTRRRVANRSHTVLGLSGRGWTRFVRHVHKLMSRVLAQHRCLFEFTNSYSDQGSPPVESADSEQFPHSRGDGRPSPGVPAGAQRDERRRHHDVFQPRAGRRRRRQQRQAAQGPLPPRLLRHPRRRVRRGVPPLPDLPRDRPDPGLARRRSSGSATSATRSPTTPASPRAASAPSRCSTPTSSRHGEVVAGPGDPRLRGPRGGRRRARRRHRRDRDPGRSPPRRCATGWSRSASAAS